MDGFRRGRGGSKLGLLLLGSQMFQFGFENIPPVTLALLAGQTAIYLDAFPDIFPSAQGVCISSYLVLAHKDFRRMVLSTFYHAHDMHLYFNMVSLLYKGSMLETRFGSPYFAYLVAVFTGLTSLTYVGLGYIFQELLNDHSYITSCAVGFSGVLFALKVLTTHYSPPGTSYLMGVVPVASKYIYWAELGLIQLIYPNASFVGHLAGILVGLLYVKGPLKFVMEIFLSPDRDFEEDENLNNRRSNRRRRRPRNSSGISSWFSSFFGAFESTRAPRFHGGGRSTPSAPSEDYNQPDNYDYHQYTGGLSEEEQTRSAMGDSTQYGAPQNSNSQHIYPDLSDLRSRRENFFR